MSSSLVLEGSLGDLREQVGYLAAVRRPVVIAPPTSFYFQLPSYAVATTTTNSYDDDATVGGVGAGAIVFVTLAVLLLMVSLAVLVASIVRYYVGYEETYVGACVDSYRRRWRRV